MLNEDIIPPTGRFSLDLSLEDEDMALFITPNHFNVTPEPEERGDIFDLLLAVSPTDPVPCGETGGKGLQDFNTSTPKMKERTLGNISVGTVDETIGDNTLKDFVENLSLSSDEDEVLSLASRIPNKSAVARLKGRRSVANPKGRQEKQIVVDADRRPISSNPPEDLTVGKTSKTNRFVHATNKDLDDLQYESKAKRTHVQTKWGIKILTGM